MFLQIPSKRKIVNDFKAYFVETNKTQKRSPISKPRTTPFNKRSAAPSPSFTLHARVTGRGPQITSRWLMPPGQLLPLVKLARWLPLYRLPIRNKTKRLLPTSSPFRVIPATLGVSCLSNRVAIVSPIEFANEPTYFLDLRILATAKGTTMPPSLPGCPSLMTPRQLQVTRG